MNPELSEIGEDALLEHFRQTLPSGGSLLVGPGDDCAVIAMPGSDVDLLLKTDALVEGVHYERGEAPERVGHKAAARVFSDIAAMGGRPAHLLVTLVLPASTRKDWLDGFYRGMNALAGSHGCRVAGGELAGLPGGAGAAVISVAATGHVAKGMAVLRSGGRPGDVLAVTGQLGGSLASGHHLDFLPRLAEGQWLAASGRVHAMMDLSDGLARDLPRLAKASGCGFQLEPDAIPRRDGCGFEAAVGDGEDYELLIAVENGAWPGLADAWKARFPDVPLTAIGRSCQRADSSRHPSRAAGIISPARRGCRPLIICRGGRDCGALPDNANLAPCTIPPTIPVCQSGTSPWFSICFHRRWHAHGWAGWHRAIVYS